MVWLGEKNERGGNFTFRSAGRLVPAFTRHARALRAPQLNLPRGTPSGTPKKELSCFLPPCAIRTYNAHQTIPLACAGNGWQRNSSQE